jgi:hypothetical protein
MFPKDLVVVEVEQQQQDKQRLLQMVEMVVVELALL